ncbi:macrolide 2'-phosphotransferase [Sutcliffiella horikoshii]|uniref:macrolide 2'-phosphotransferase n=1 Tax=Sutcliffiella horikoshii TaxID=79883 RepID=UPI001F15C5BD|nr:macrolide 2'-phosphotransferase [Sutcliffiella horikoshii]MCG1023516.1 macrolide 2'-phosphotransferase [Sutcliffiella horikoshii]
MTLTKEKVIEIAKDNGLDILADSLTFNESGLDFLVVFAEDAKGEEWVLRFPRREDVIASTQKEKRTLDLVRASLTVEAPNWLIYNDSLIAYKRLTGVPAATVDPEAQAYVWVLDEKNVPTVFNETLARALVSLHHVDHEDVRAAGLLVETPEEIRENMAKRMEKVKEEFHVDPGLWQRWQAWLKNDSLWPAKTTLVHGDLHAGHILIDEVNKVTGFIDWTEAAVGDIAIDFVAHYRTFGEDVLKELIHHYEKAGGYVWPGMAQHVIELTAAYPIAIAEFALKSGLEEYMDMAKQVLGGNGE